MLIHFVTDAPNKIPAIRAMLEPQHVVQPHVLGAASGQALSNGVLVVDADLRQAVPVEHLKAVLQNLQRISEKLFVVQSHLRDMIAQALRLARPQWCPAPGMSPRSWRRSRSPSGR